jgi:plastocyanin domain-containing protein
MKRTYLLAGLVFAVVYLGVVVTPAQKRNTQPKPQTARIEVTRNGYEPGSIKLKRNVPARITFRRTVESTCATEVVFADYGINRLLPLNQDVVVTFTPRKSGEFAFTCGMNMHRGKLIVS